MSNSITPPPKRLIALMGPTASGKTSLAIALAKKYSTEIISVDSRQFYREITIGTAKPDSAQLAEVKHHFINNLSIHQEYTAGHFARDANLVIDDLFKTHDTVIAVGGSTLYFQALLEGIDEFPEITKEAREKVKDIEKNLGKYGLRNALEKADPLSFYSIDIENPRRLIRALEVCFSEGKPYSSYLKKSKPKNKDYSVIKIGIDVPRPVLYQRINDRCDEMIAEGLLEEVKELYPYRHLKPLHTVGYTEFFDYIDGKCSLEEAMILFKQHTRNYAKRQVTWLRQEEGLEWMGAEAVLNFIEQTRSNPVKITGNDLDKTLEQLESDYWGPPPIGPDVTGLVIKCHLLRQKPLKKFTIENLRLMILQNFSLEYLIPRSFAYLSKNIMSEGNLYEGDLLNSVLVSKPDYWKTHPKERNEFIKILYEGQDQINNFDMTDKAKYKLLKQIDEFIKANS